MTADEAALDAMREHLYELLRRARPRVLLCVMQSGEKRKIDTGGGRQVRYAQIARQVVVMAPELDRLDLCNAKGELIESWHPRGQPVEDEDEPAALPEIPVAGDAQAIVAFALATAERMLAAVQKATDHATDRARLGQKDLIEGFAKLAGAMGDRLSYIERQQTQSFKLVRDSLVLEGQARQQALDALRLAEDKNDPNDPDAIMGDFVRQVMGRQLGPGQPGAAETAPKRTGRRDHDEPS